MGRLATIPTVGALWGTHCALASQANEAASEAYREAQIGRVHAIGHHYYSWATTTWPGSLEADDITVGRVPMVSLRLPFLSQVNDGSNDAYLTARAQACAAFAFPIMFRPGWEMNGNWYDWSGPSNGDDPGAYIRAWQRIWRIFQQAGAANVQWVWCPNASSSPGGTTVTHANNWRYYYPGDRYVDWVSTDCYNWGDYNPGSYGTWQNLRNVLDPIVVDWKADFGGFGGSVKPFVLAEWGCFPTPGIKAHWITDAVAYMKTVGLHAVSVFDTNNSVIQGQSSISWNVDSDAASLTAFTEAAGDPYFGGTAVGGGSYRSKVLADAPYGYWKLDRLTGTYPDLGSGNNPGTPTALANRGAPALRPGLGSGVSFNGSSRVDLGLLGTLGSQLSAGFSVEFLIKMGSAVTAASRPQTAVLGTLNTGTTTGLIVGADTNRSLASAPGLTAFWYRNEAGVARSQDINTAIYDGLWHHVLWVCDPTAAADVVYIDGTAVTPFSTSNAANVGASANFGFALYIGARNNRGSVDQQITAAVDELAIYTTKLSGTRAGVHYAALTA